MNSLTPLLRSRVHSWLLPLLMISSLVPIWSTTYFPSQNGPWHLLTVKMLHDYTNPAFNYAEFYVPSFHAIPHLVHTLLVYLLAFVFPLLVAHKIVISLYALLFPVSVFWFLATVNPKRVAAGYVTFLFIYSVPLLRGYHDYALGIPLVFLTLTYWLRHRDRMTVFSSALVMLLIVCVYLSHVFNFMVLGLAMVVFAVHQRRSLRPVYQIAILLLPAALLLAEYTVYNVQHAVWLNKSELMYLAPHVAVNSFFERFFSAFSATAYYLAVTPLLLGIPMLSRSLKKAYRRSGQVWYRVAFYSPALTLFLLLTLLYLVTPFKLLGWHYVNVRFVPYVIIFALASLNASGRLERRAVVMTISIAALGIFYINTVHFQRTGRMLEEYLSALPKMRPNSVLLPLAFDGSQVGRMSPLAHAYDYYHIYRGGANGKGIAKFNTVTPMVYRTYPVTRVFPRWESYRPARMHRVVQTYDYVLIWGGDLNTTVFLQQAGFKVVHEQGQLRFFENRRGRLEVEALMRHE